MVIHNVCVHEIIERGIKIAFCSRRLWIENSSIYPALHHLRLKYVDHKAPCSVVNHSGRARSSRRKVVTVRSLSGGDVLEIRFTHLIPPLIAGQITGRFCLSHELQVHVV